MDASSDALDAGLLRYSDGAVVGTGGFVEADGQRLNVRHVQPITGPESWLRCRCWSGTARCSGWPTSGEVLVDPGPLIGDAVVNDGPGLLLVVQKFRGANTVDVTEGVEQAMREMQPGLPGIDGGHHDLPARHLHRAVDRQPDPGDALRRRSGRC